MRVRELALCLVLGSLTASHEARAQATAPTSAPPVAPEAPANPPLPLTISLDHSKLDPEAIRRAIELELKRPVALTHNDARANAATDDTPQSLTVIVHSDHTVSVSYHAANGVTRTRSIGLPQDDARGAETIALLSGNLSRDEAAELLADLAAKAGSPAAAATPESDAKPPATPAEATNPEPAAPVTAKPPQPAPPKNKNQTSPNDLLILPYPAFNLTLVHPTSLIRHSERYVINGELGLVYSRVGALNGVGFNVMVLQVDRDVRGLAFASFYNHSGGISHGISGAGLVNAYHELHGCALAGIANVGQDSDGCAIAGIVNWTRIGQGFQIAGVLNDAGKFSGLQLSGVTNVAAEIRGMQVGLVNVAGNVTGTQIGVVNVAKHVEGTSLGLVSVVGNGRVQPVLWASTFMPLNAAAKFTVGSFYTQLGGGYAPDNHTYTYELGIGAHLPAGRLFFEPGVHYSEQRDAKRYFSHELSENVHYRIAVGLDLHSVSPFLGAALVQRFAHESDAPDSHALAVEGFGGVAFF